MIGRRASLLVWHRVALALALVASSTASAAAYRIALLPIPCRPGASRRSAQRSRFGSRVGFDHLKPCGLRRRWREAAARVEGSIVRNVWASGSSSARGRSKVVTLTVQRSLLEQVHGGLERDREAKRRRQGRRLSPRGSRHALDDEDDREPATSRSRRSPRAAR